MSIVTPKTDFIDLLQRLSEFLDNYVDVEDGDYGEPRPNKAMRLWQDVDEALTELSGLEEQPDPQPSHKLSRQEQLQALADSGCDTLEEYKCER